MPACREYNALVASVSGEVAAMKKVQAESMAVQMELDKDSLERLKEAEQAKKVTHTSQHMHPVATMCCTG